MAKKRRKATADEWMGDVRKWAKGHPQTVRMRMYSSGPYMGWFWEVHLGHIWMQPHSDYTNGGVGFSKGGAKRSGNAWLRRLEKQFGMKLTPRWE